MEIEGLETCGEFELRDVTVPLVRAGTLLVRMEAVPLLTYLGQFVTGGLPTYRPAEGEFTPGTNGVGVVEAIGEDIWDFAWPAGSSVPSSGFNGQR